MHLQIVLFHAWLNLKYPSSATPLGPLIEKLLAEQERATTEMSPDQQLGNEGRLYRLAFGTRVPPFIRKT